MAVPKLTPGKEHHAMPGTDYHYYHIMSITIIMSIIMHNASGVHRQLRNVDHEITQRGKDFNEYINSNAGKTSDA